MFVYVAKLCTRVSKTIDYHVILSLIKWLKNVTNAATILCSFLRFLLKNILWRSNRPEGCMRKSLDVGKDDCRTLLSNKTHNIADEIHGTRAIPSRNRCEKSLSLVFAYVAKPCTRVSKTIDCVSYRWPGTAQESWNSGRGKCSKVEPAFPFLFRPYLLYETDLRPVSSFIVQRLIEIR